jgi:hypothetical protein
LLHEYYLKLWKFVSFQIFNTIEHINLPENLSIAVKFDVIEFIFMFFLVQYSRKLISLAQPEVRRLPP